MTFVLRDIRPDDKQALTRFHAGLSAESRYRRYHAAKGDLTAGDLRYLTEVDGERHVALVAEDTDGELLGVARSVALDEQGSEAELAIVVRDDRQADGLGGSLVRGLRDRAKQSGVEHLIAEVQADNHRALRFFQGLGARQRTPTVGAVCPLVIDVHDEPR